MSPERRIWRKSSFSGNGAACVEVMQEAAGALVRDSKNTDGPVLAFPATDWRTFVRRLG